MVSDVAPSQFCGGSRILEFCILSYQDASISVGRRSSKEDLRRHQSFPLRNSSSICVGRLCCCPVAPGAPFVQRVTLEQWNIRIWSEHVVAKVEVQRKWLIRDTNASFSDIKVQINRKSMILSAISTPIAPFPSEARLLGHVSLQPAGLSAAASGLSGAGRHLARAQGLPGAQSGATAARRRVESAQGVVHLRDGRAKYGDVGSRWWTDGGDDEYRVGGLEHEF